MPNTTTILQSGALATQTFAPPGAGRTIYNPERPLPPSRPRAEPPSAYALFCLTHVVSQPGLPRNFLRAKWASLRSPEKAVYLEAAEKKREEFKWLADVSAVPEEAMLPYTSLLPIKDADPTPNPRPSRALKTSGNGDVSLQGQIYSCVSQACRVGPDNGRVAWIDRAAPESIEKTLWLQEIDPDILHEMEQAYIDFSACEGANDLDPKDPSDTAGIDENVSITGSETEVEDAYNQDRRGDREWSVTSSVASEEHFRMEF